jgi:CubicO group peptidase (beta-lactamase class C family)
MSLSIRTVVSMVALLLALPCPTLTAGSANERIKSATAGTAARKVYSSPIRPVLSGNSPFRLKPYKSRRAFEPRYLWKDATNTLRDFNEKTFTRGLLILKNDQVVLEQYFAGADRKTLFPSYSVGKSFTSTLVGIALNEGYIKSVDEKLTVYLPALTGGPYDGATIKDALQMLAGVPFEEGTYDAADPTNPFSRVMKQSVVEQRYRFVEAANTLKRATEPGSKFTYSTMDTCLLGWLVENATGMRLSHYLQERLWRPAGMDRDAALTLDGPPEIGREFGGGGVLATLRDFGRFGLVALHQGQINGKQIVSEQWFREATTPDRPAIDFGKLYPGYPYGYGYQWWILPNGDFAAMGVKGQFIHISPAANVVIVKLSDWPSAWDTDLEQETAAFFHTVLAALK